MTMEPFRAEMGVAEQYAYFDHAAVAPLSNRAAARLKAFAVDACQNGDRNWLQWSTELGQLRKLLARVLCVSDLELALVSNTTQGINLIAEGYHWQPGDNVVVPDNEFPSNLLPWRNLARRGVEIRLIPVGADGAVNADQIVQRMDQNTRIVALSWVGFASGYRIDLEQIVERVHARGALLFLDAIQGLGVFPLDLSAVAVDFLAADGHKWMLGPEGAGVLFIREQHLGKIEPHMLGWGSLAEGSFDPQAMRLKPTAARFEGGSSNMAGLLALHASLQMLMELGLNHSHIAQAVLENVARITDQLRSRGFEVIVPQAVERRSGILGVNWPGANPLAVRKHCLENNVILSVRGGRLRVSTHAYNNATDIQRLVDVLSDSRAKTHSS